MTVSHNFDYFDPLDSLNGWFFEDSVQITDEKQGKRVNILMEQSHERGVLTNLNVKSSFKAIKFDLFRYYQGKSQLLISLSTAIKNLSQPSLTKDQK